MSDDENPPSPFEPDGRPRGILTKKDREFLISQEDFDAQTKRDKRYRIRNRVVDAYLDFQVLETFLPEEDREKIFEELREKYTFTAISDTLQFTYSGVSDLDEEFEQALESVIVNHERKKNPDVIPHVSVDIDIRTEEVSVEDAINRFLEGEGTFKEFNFLMSQPDGLHQLADKVEEAERDAKMLPPEEDAEPRTIEPDRIRELAEHFTPDEDE